MSNTRNRMQGAGCRVALLLMLAALPLDDARGQTAGELSAAVRRLENEVALAKQEEDSIRAIEDQQAIARFVPVPVGGLELLTVPELRTTAEAAGRLVWEVLALSYQDSIAVVLRKFPISIVQRPRQNSTTGVLYPRYTRLVFAPEDDAVRGLAAGLLAQITQELWLGQDQGLRNWLKSPPPITLDLSGAFSAAYLDLATSASPIAQRCLVAVSDCREALGLTRPEDPAAEWYSPSGRRQLVIHLTGAFQVGESRQLYDRCIGGSDSDCRALLREVPDIIPSPLLAPTRTTFLRVALERGGPGSYPVLLSSGGLPIAARIDLASGSGGASVEEWHRRVIAARPAPTTTRRGQALSAMGWTALLLTFALRSSRWR